MLRIAIALAPAPSKPPSCPGAIPWLDCALLHACQSPAPASIRMMKWTSRRAYPRLSQGPYDEPLCLRTALRHLWPPRLQRSVLVCCVLQRHQANKTYL